MSEKKGNYISQAWLVILLALLYGGGLAAVQIGLSGKIAENKKNETYNQIPSLVDGADASKTEEVLVNGADGKEIRVYKAMNAEGEHLGWVIPAGGQGFADRIECLIGTNADLSLITGIYVLDQKETPGLGDFITGEDFRNRFKEKPTEPALVVVKGEASGSNEILSLTGATISSDAVTSIVNNALTNVKAELAGQSSKPAKE